MFSVASYEARLQGRANTEVLHARKMRRRGLKERVYQQQLHREAVAQGLTSFPLVLLWLLNPNLWTAIVNIAREIKHLIDSLDPDAAP